MENYPHGLLFDEALHAQIREKFCYLESDPEAGERLFFENAGGSLRLKACNAAYSEADAFPDCDSRKHSRAKWLRAKTLQGFADMRTLFNAEKYGQIIFSTSSSRVMFRMVQTVMDNAKGTNIVTTEIEHPSVFDSMFYFGRKHNMEVRIARANKVTGGVDPEAIAALVDENTALVNCIYACNINGAVIDLESVVRECRKKNPLVYILCDAVQHAPHGVIDVQKCPVDGINFAAYKIFGNRGFGVGYLSPRMAELDHPNITGNCAGDPWEIGGPAPASFAAVSEIVNYVCWIGSHFTDSEDRRTLFEAGMHRMELHERALLHATLEGTDKQAGLRHLTGVNVHFDTPDLTKWDFIMAVTFDNMDTATAVAEYQKRGVIVYDRVDSNWYSVRCLHPFGLSGVIRVSPLHPHSIADVEKFLQATAQIAAL